MDIKSVTHVQNIRLNEDKTAIIIIDQTLLPNETVYLTVDTAEKMYDAIHELRVRGAPAIGIFAAYSMYVLALGFPKTGFEEFFSEFKKYSAYLDSSRPTAVNLHTMLRRMEDRVLSCRDMDIDKIIAAMLSEAVAIHEEDMEMCYKISEYGLSLVKDGDGVLTHCNAGPLATSRYGTAQGPFYLGKERGIKLRAYCDETRPLLQGARLTSYELTRAGVECTLICDNMASSVMRLGLINACFVGCDRIALNGDTANKVGTSGVAILAKYYNIPVYVLGPSSTIDFECETGEDIKIELRDPDEIKTKFYCKPMALPEVRCYNPSFDVTDNALIAGIVTERGICRPPYRESFRKMFPDKMKREE